MARWARQAALALALASGLRPRRRARRGVAALDRVRRAMGLVPPGQRQPGFPGRSRGRGRQPVRLRQGFLDGPRPRGAPRRRLGRGAVGRPGGSVERRGDRRGARWQPGRSRSAPWTRSPSSSTRARTARSCGGGTFLRRLTARRWNAVRAIAVDAAGAVVSRPTKARRTPRAILFKLGADGAPVWRLEDAGAFALAGRRRRLLRGAGHPRGGARLGAGACERRGRRHARGAATRPSRERRASCWPLRPMVTSIASGVLRQVDVGSGAGVVRIDDQQGDEGGRRGRNGTLATGCGPGSRRRKVPIPTT